MKSIIYRHFSKEGILLYIGSSINAIYRQYQHGLHSSWFDEIAYITFEKVKKEILLDAERFAIKNENPKHNKYLIKNPIQVKKPPFKAPVDVKPFELWNQKEQKKYGKLLPREIKSICNDKRVCHSIAHEKKLDINTIYFIKEGRHKL